MKTDRTYRVTRWPALTGKFDSLKFRRALIAMSVDSVSEAWIERHCRLHRRELSSLLAELTRAGLLEVGWKHFAPEPIRQNFWERQMAAESLLGGLYRLGVRRLRCGKDGDDGARDASGTIASQPFTLDGSTVPLQ